MEDDILTRSPDRPAGRTPSFSRSAWPSCCDQVTFIYFRNQIFTEYIAAECLLADAASTSSACTGGRRTDYSTLMISFNQSGHLEIHKVYPHHAAAELVVPHNMINDSQQSGTINKKIIPVKQEIEDYAILTTSTSSTDGMFTGIGPGRCPRSLTPI
ncbi:2-dehydropantoate 2-reductase family protein [Aspergillus niger]|uniref:2-dehydropantoate 2-reductase family protein n=1 Tax=Aspergillus niger TaxID=5061 RepID=A0A505I0J9_ASPNG|nr:2-dehydropantoate 2-reductase family protein [Aspergillus niger]